MRTLIRQFEKNSWPAAFGPIAVSAHDKNLMNKLIRNSAGNRDGPLIFHLRDGPPNVNGPPGGFIPPGIISGGTDPPEATGPMMDWLVRKIQLGRPG